MKLSLFLVSIILAVGVFLATLIVGFLIIAGGEMMLALREITLNTRRDIEVALGLVDRQAMKIEESRYKSLLIAARIYKWIGWVFIIGGIVAALFIVLFKLRLRSV